MGCVTSAAVSLGYACLVSGLMRIGVLGYDIAAPALSVVKGAQADGVMFALVSQSAGRGAGAATVALRATWGTVG